MPSLLDLLRKQTVIDVDQNDARIAEQFSPVADMTSNQLLVLAEVSKHPDIMEEAVLRARQLKSKLACTDEEFPALVVDCATVKLGQAVFPLLQPTGFVHAQTDVHCAYDRVQTIVSALRLATLYELAGLPRTRICIKIPSTLAGLEACAELEKEHSIRTLATTCFSVGQGLAAAAAGCLYVAPYINPLIVHLDPSKHVIYKDPLAEMRGIKVAQEIQRVYRKLGTKTQVLAASLVTAGEMCCLAGLDHVTLSAAALKLLDETESNDHYIALMDNAVKSLQSDSTTALRESWMQDYSATNSPELIKALEEVADLQKEALDAFGEAQDKLLAMAKAAMHT